MKFMVVMPTYNEKGNIGRIIPIILELGGEILVVDDNSPDGTGKIVDKMAKKDKRIHVLHREKKQGLGTAYKAGFAEALKLKPKYIIEMDADFSHNPKYIKEMLKLITKYDVVIGSRYINGISVVNWPLKRLFLSYFANYYARIITGLKIQDCTGGFKCFRRGVLEKIDFSRVSSEGYAFQIEMNYIVKCMGGNVKEFPIIFEDRQAGKSNMSKKIIIEAFYRVWFFRFKNYNIKKIR